MFNSLIFQRADTHTESEIATTQSSVQRSSQDNLAEDLLNDMNGVASQNHEQNGEIDGSPTEITGERYVKIIL